MYVFPRLVYVFPTYSNERPRPTVMVYDSADFGPGDQDKNDGERRTLSSSSVGIQKILPPEIWDKKKRPPAVSDEGPGITNSVLYYTPHQCNDSFFPV